MKNKKKKPVRGEAILVTLILFGAIIFATGWIFYTMIVRTEIVETWNSLGKGSETNGDAERKRN